MGKRDAEHARSDIDRYRKQLGITCLRLVIVCYHTAPAVINERLVLDLPIDLQFTITVNSVYANRPPVCGNFLTLFFDYGAYKSKTPYTPPEIFRTKLQAIGPKILYHRLNYTFS